MMEVISARCLLAWLQPAAAFGEPEPGRDDSRLLLLRECVEVLVSPDEQNIVCNRRSGRCPLAKLRIRGHYFWLLGSSFQDSHSAVIKRREIDMPVGGH